MGPDPVQVHVISSMDEFRLLSGPLAQRGVDGFARSREGIVVVKAPALLGPGANYAAILRHELLHVLLARNTAPGALPRWLNEGVAMTLSREFRWSSMVQVARMYVTGSVIPYDDLGRAFAAPGNEVEFGGAYAQSLSMTKYLREIAGEDAFWFILRDLKSQSFERSLERRTGLSPPEFFEEWEHSLWQTAVASYSLSGLAALPLGALLLTLAYFLKRRRGQRIVKEWEAEDAEEEEDPILFPSDLEGQDPPYPWEEDE